MTRLVRFGSCLAVLALVSTPASLASVPIDAALPGEASTPPAIGPVAEPGGMTVAMGPVAEPGGMTAAMGPVAEPGGSPAVLLSPDRDG